MGQDRRSSAESVRDLKHGVVHLLQRIHALLKLNVVRGKLSLSWQGVSMLTTQVAGALLDPSQGPEEMSKDRTLSTSWPSVSLTSCCVRAAKGVNEALQRPGQHIKRSVIRERARGRRQRFRASVRDVLAKGAELLEVVHYDVGSEVCRKS